MTGPLVRHFRTLAAYNRLANLRLYETCSRLGEAELKAQRSSFFGSIHGTLNHVMVGDRIWLARFAGEEAPSTNLDAILYETFGDLRAAREREDARIVAYVAGLSEATLAGRFRYRTIVNPADVEQPLAPVLIHLFNHQTHHRGQVHALLTGLGHDAPSLDLILFQRATGIGLS